MTKKDYILISKTLKDIFDCNAFCLDDDNDKFSVAYRFAEALRATNPAFDREQFLTACGVEKPEADPDEE